MLLYPEINKLKKRTDSRYTLVALAAKRARDIIAGKPVLTDLDAERPVSLAAQEIADQIITYNRIEDPVKDLAEEAAAEQAAEAEADEFAEEAATGEALETEAEEPAAEDAAEAEEV